MIQLSPVIPGHEDIPETVFGANQEGVQPLPGVRVPSREGQVITRWAMTAEEADLLNRHGGEVYLTILTGGDRLQPVCLFVATPEQVWEDVKEHYVAPEDAIGEPVLVHSELVEPDEPNSEALVPVPKLSFQSLIEQDKEIYFQRYHDGTLQLFPRGSMFEMSPARYSENEVSVKVLVSSPREKFIVVLPTTRQWLDTPGAEDFLAQKARDWER